MFFQETYGLRAHSGIVYCYSALEDKSPDALDWSFLVVISIIFAVLAFATIYDMVTKRTKSDNQQSHYETVKETCKSL